MKAGFTYTFVPLTMFILVTAAANRAECGEALIVNHTCTDLGKIPVERIEQVKTVTKLHYAHTSHGGQLVAGLARIFAVDTFYRYAYENNALPIVPGALCIYNGQSSETYITPDLYWRTLDGMDETRGVISENPPINMSMWSWCGELETYSEVDVQAYLDSLHVLELDYPDTLFIYMTGNAQLMGARGHNRYLRNEQIRAFCLANGKVLFDFADLDSWWYNPATERWEQTFYYYEGHNVPVEHPMLAGNDAYHTSFESCEQKARALWWMLAKLSGWAGPTSVKRITWGNLKDLYD